MGELCSRQVRFGRRVALGLVAIATALGSGCRNDGVVLGQAGNPGAGGVAGMGSGGASGGHAGAGVSGASGGGGSSPGSGGSSPGSGGSSGAPFDGGVTPTDGGVATFAWVDLSPCHFPATIPAGTRTDAMGAFDSDRGKLIVYGAGYSDLWEVDVTTGLRTDRTTCAFVDSVPNSLSALVYDAGRKRVVLFPYSGASDVSEWDPVAGVWTDRSAPSGSAGVPDGEARVALYDPTGGRVIVFVTHAATQFNAMAIWSWEGATGAWTLLQDPFPVADAYSLPSLAFDPGRGVVWGFGGGETGSPRDDLWTWNVATSTLTDLTPTTLPAAWPSARLEAGLAYDGTRGKLVLYGGFDGTNYLQDTWEWDPVAATWTDRTASGVSRTGGDPPPGVAWPGTNLPGGERMFADPVHGRVVLLQTSYLTAIGHSGAWLWDGQHGTWNEPVANTVPALWPESQLASLSTAWDGDERALYLATGGTLWRWTADDGVWTALAFGTGSGAPNDLPWLDGVAMAYDPKARQVVVFGGSIRDPVTVATTLTANLWRWNPATSQLSSSSPPTGAAWPEPRNYAAMTYDPVRQRVLLFGGGKPEASKELWALDTANASWTDLSGASAAAGATWPEARIHPRFVLDPDRNVILLKGGGDSTAQPVQALDSTWELAAGTTSWSKRADASNSTPYGWPVTFMSGVGLVTLSLSWDPNSTYFGLWRWDSANAVWTSLDVASPVMPVGDVQGPVGVGGRLLWLNAQFNNTTTPLEDEAFFHLWQWGPR